MYLQKVMLRAPDPDSRQNVTDPQQGIFQLNNHAVGIWISLIREFGFVAANARKRAVHERNKKIK
jgi:hypothetical protein